MTKAPLADVRVIAIEQYGAGPWGSMQLADLGADVIKLEDPAAKGDVARYVPPFQHGEDSLFFESFNRNKRSICLDLRTPEGASVLRRLVREADAVYSNLRGDGPAHLGITYAQLCEVNPRIVCCSLSGYGMSGPRAADGAYDYVIQGLAGWMALTGDPDGPPARSGLPVVDLAGGYVAALALMAGVWRARRDGVGCDCDLSLHETALAMLSYLGTWTATEGYRPQRQAESAHPSVVPFQVFATADGWIVVACPKQKFWHALIAALEMPELGEDPRFATMAVRLEHRTQLLGRLRKRFASQATDELLRLLNAAKVPCGPVNDVVQALADPQAIARGAVIEVEHPRLGKIFQVASPLRLDERWRAARPGPARGEHTADVLRELGGYGEAEIAALAKAGVLGFADLDGDGAQSDHSAVEGVAG
ncbi:MAG TPA: CoA transferase [Solirubrobacteraceae bacterium]|jgi:crotonobetainyl-CoA:carnitine CoA-transferase CaiB-like acyl-CoA transferase|nr:CoA transferase [Solirubrobacteraceae bacterium]